MLGTRISLGALVSLLAVSLHAGAPSDSAQAGGLLFGAVVRSVDYAADAPLERLHYDPLVGLRPGDILTRTAVKHAIQGLYGTGEFASVAVDAEPVTDGVAVRFRLRFNYYFDRFLLTGDVDLEGRAPEELIQFPIGERFTPEGLEQSRSAVAGFLESRGYYGARIQVATSTDPGEFQVRTTFEIEKGKRATLSSCEIRGVPEREEAEVRQRLRVRLGGEFVRRRLQARLEDLRRHLVKRGFLGVSPELSETYDPSDNSVSLVLAFSNFGRVRVSVDGYKIPKEQWARLLPVLSGEGLDRDLLEEGRRNLREYLEERGYSEADVNWDERTEASGIRVIRYVIQSGPRVSVSYVRFRGHQVLGRRDLEAATRIRPAQFLQKSVYSIAKLDADVEALKGLYRSRGYLEAQVIPLIEPIDNAEKLGITFEITEGELSRTGVVTLAGNRSLDAASLLPRLRLQAGAAFSPALAELDRQALLAAYNDAGFSRARVTPKIGARDGTGSYPVDYDIEEGPRSFVDNILILGNDTTRDPVITSRIALRRGEPLSLGKMLQTQQALSDLGIFDNVEVAPQNPEADAPYQDLNVRVRESKRFTVRYGLGYETREKVRGTLELSDLNILGRAVRADMRLRASAVEQAAVLTVQRSQVQFRPVHSYFSASASSESDVSFDQVRLATSYQYSKPIGTHSWGLMRVNYRNVRVYNVSEDLEPEDEPRNLTTLSAIYVNDTRDSFVDAERGFFTSTDLSVTTRWLGSNNYFSLYTQNSYYRRLPGDFVVAAALRVGLAAPYGRDTSIPISERFFAGGASSLRGFETDYAGPLDPDTGDPAGGNALVIGNFEVRLPLVKSFRLAGFYDVGNVFSYIKDIRPADFSHTVGAGLRIKTPLGPLRLDYGYNLNLTAEQKLRLYKPNQWFITIGSPF